MQARDGVFLEDLCPKLRARRWRQTLHQLTDHRCLYCGAPSESIDHVFPRSRGGVSSDENCVPACLTCNGDKGDSEAFLWYRSQQFYDPRRAMALRAWVEGDRMLAQRLLSWAAPQQSPRRIPAPETASGSASGASNAPLNTPERAAEWGERPSTGPRRNGQEPRGNRRPGKRNVPQQTGIRADLSERSDPRPRRSGERSRRPTTPTADQTAAALEQAEPLDHQTRQAATPLWRWQMAS